MKHRTESIASAVKFSIHSGFVHASAFGASWMPPAGSRNGSRNHCFGNHVGKMMKNVKTRPENTLNLDGVFVFEMRGFEK